MVDYLGYRAKMGVTTPSTNTVVQPEYDDMRPPGVTNHLGRMHIENIPTTDDNSFDKSIELIDAGLTGYLVPPDQPQALLEQLPAALALDRQSCRRQAERRFGLEAFGARLEAWIKKTGVTA